MLHPGAKWLFRLSAYFGFGLIVVFIFAFPFLGLTGILATTLTSNLNAILLSILVGILILLLVVIIFGEIYTQMAYNRWFYEFTPTNLRIEKGIIWKKYSNIPYERIQNIDITRGIIARLAGFSTVNIQTAGYAASYGRGGMPHSEGYIPAVGMDEAEQIREFVISKINRHKSQGL